MKRRLYLVGYDIQSNKRRRRALLSLKSHAIGGQKSLYECWFTDSELSTALNSLRTIIDTDEDRILVIRLDPRALLYTIGIAVAPPNGDFFYHC